MITVCVKSKGLGWVAGIRTWEDVSEGHLLSTEWSAVERLTHNEAMVDAEKMRNEALRGTTAIKR